MRCLVTGVGGFIGSHIAEALIARGDEVVGIDCFVPYYPRGLKDRNLQQLLDHERFLFFEQDLSEIDLHESHGSFDEIYHQAAQAGVRASWGKYFDSYERNNILATQRLLESLRTTNSKTKVVYASSSSIYGDAEKFPTSEDLTPAPVSPYGVTKLAGEHLMRLYATEFEVHTVSLRYFTVYGPRQRPDMAFHRFCRAALSGETIQLFGDGEQSRDFTFISDIVAANLQAAEFGKAGAVFNLGGGEISTVNAALQIIAELSGNELVIDKKDRQAGDARHTSANTALAQEAIRFAPKVSVREGLEQELRWVSENLDFLRKHVEW